MIELRLYQKRLLSDITEAMRSYKHCVVQLGTGGGKTLLFSEIARRASLKGSNVLILSNRTELLNQAGGSLDRIGVKCEYISPKHRSIPTVNVVDSMTQTLRRRYEKPAWIEYLKTVDLLIIDEGHVSDSDYILESGLFKDKYVLSFTATPKRSGKMRQLGLDFQCIVLGEKTESLIKQGFLVPARYFTLDAPDLSNVDINPIDGDYKTGKLATVFSTAERYDGLITEYNKICPNTKALCFCASQLHAIHTCIELNNAGIPSKFLVSGFSKEDDGYSLLKEYAKYTGKREDVIKEFKDGKFQILTNARMLTTGFDCPDIETVILNSATLSLPLYLQCLDSKTEILCKSGWKGIDSISYSDLCAGYCEKTGIVSWENIDNIVKRKVSNDENFYGIANNYTDIRVTGGHRMIVLKRHGKKELRSYTNAEHVNASDICNLSHSDFAVPVCGDLNNQRSNFSKNELIFIGLCITDGYLRGNQMTISQSSNNKTIPEIEHLLDSLGMPYSKYTVKRDKTNYDNAHDLFHYRISRFYDRGKNKGEKGWDYLSSLMDKNLGHGFDYLSREDWMYVLHGMNIGNGSKTEKIDWVRRTYTISVSNSVIADRLQSLLVTSGIKCNIHPTESECWLCHISSERSYKTICRRSSDNRPVFSMLEKDNDEFAWCISNTTSNIITRRNGKVTVMGNCLGRGSRPFKDKKNFFVLDFGGNIARFGGGYELDRKWSLWHEEKSGNSTPPMKICPSDKKDKEGKTGCARMLPIMYQECPFCHYIFATEKEIREIELTEIINGEFKFRDMTAAQLLAYAELNGKSKQWAFGQIWMGSDCDATFRREMRNLGYSNAYIYRLLDGYAKKKRKRYESKP